LLNADVNVAIASDFWVTEPDFMRAFYNGMTRQISQNEYEKTYGSDSKHRWVSNPKADLNHGDLGILPPLNERVELEEMIRASTWNGAYANFLEEDIGSIEVGKLADLVVLDQNLFRIDIESIPETKVEMTFFEGKQVF
jgi:predicted amidohydrolase YtcJ